ncbi:unnamed protein product [Brassica napus]|uniref:(rape) hypothetical protein n=1 Tax=Brassica napus TaxID=3708 RepID=A0A816K4G3_BRANA|nr:unnamed protein product [Brassica napus]
MALIPCNCLFNWFLLDEDLSLDLSILGRSESWISLRSISPWISLRSISLVGLSAGRSNTQMGAQIVTSCVEPLEKICFTEEHEKYLSDGSQSSKKRIRDAFPSVESNIKATPVTGNPLRICFVFKKPRESEVVVPQVPQEDRVCSTSGTEISSSVSGHDENLLPASLDSDKTTVLSESKKRKNIRQA